MIGRLELEGLRYHSNESLSAQRIVDRPFFTPLDFKYQTWCFTLRTEFFRFPVSGCSTRPL